MDPVKKGVIIVGGILIGVPIIIWLLIKKPFIIIAAIVLGAVILLPLLERKVGLA